MKTRRDDNKRAMKKKRRFYRVLEEVVGLRLFTGNAPRLLRRGLEDGKVSLEIFILKVKEHNDKII
jgi:hypothetical protein